MTFLEALNITIVSMIIVFILLAALMGIIYLQTYLIKVVPEIFGKNKMKSLNKKEENLELLNKFEDVEEKEQNSVEDTSSDDELETVAAIMAALSQYMGVPEQKLAIKSIKRVNPNNSRWANADLN